jgi:7-carboxy-7-deazaguanine synthase
VHHDWVCVSPKLNMPGGKVVRPEALAGADEFKHVAGRQRDIDALDVLLAGRPSCFKMERLLSLPAVFD